MRIALFSDMHLPPHRGDTVHGVDAWATFEACLSQMRTLSGGVDLLVVGGDLLMDGTSGDYGEVGAALLSCGIPVHVGLGNHDDREVYRRTAPKELDTGSINATVCHSFDCEDLHVVILDSATGGGPDGGSLGAEQLEWLADDLGTAGDRRVVLFLHHPPVDVGVAWLDAIGLRDRSDFWRVLGPHAPRVRGVFCSHVHMHRTTSRGGALIATSPSTAFQFSGTQAEEEFSSEPAGFLLVDVLSDSTVVQSIRL